MKKDIYLTKYISNSWRYECG